MKEVSLLEAANLWNASKKNYSGVKQLHLSWLKKQLSLHLDEAKWISAEQ